MPGLNTYLMSPQVKEHTSRILTLWLDSTVVATSGTTVTHAMHWLYNVCTDIHVSSLFT